MSVLRIADRLLMTKRLSLHRKTGRLVKSSYGNEKSFRFHTEHLAGFTAVRELIGGTT